MYEDLIKKLHEYSSARKGEIAEITKKAAEAIEELSYKYEKALSDLVKGNKSNWISITERLPDESEPVIAFIRWSDYEDNEICYGQYIKNGRFRLMHYVEGELIKGYEVKAWMPLPEPPKEE